MALTIRRGQHEQCAALSRTRSKSGERRRRAVEAVMRVVGLEPTEAYRLAMAAELVEAAERPRGLRHRGCEG